MILCSNIPYDVTALQTYSLLWRYSCTGSNERLASWLLDRAIMSPFRTHSTLSTAKSARQEIVAFSPTVMVVFPTNHNPALYRNWQPLKCFYSLHGSPWIVSVSSEGALTRLSIEQVYVPITWDGDKELLKMLSYLDVRLSLRYWVVTKDWFMVSAIPSLVHVTFVGGDPREEQFRVKTFAELSCSDKMLTCATVRRKK